jgi:hypothetical protein
MPQARVVAPDTAVRAGPAAAAAGVIGLQGLGLMAAGGWLMVRALDNDAHHRGSTEVLGVMSILVGVGVLFLARAVRRRNGRVRSLLLVLEIICLPIAVTSWQGGRWYAGLPLTASALLVLIFVGRAGLLTPSGDSPADDD